MFTEDIRRVDLSWDMVEHNSHRHVTFSDQVPVPAGYAPVHFDSVSYDLQPSLNLAELLEAEDKSDWTFLSMLGLNM